MTDFELAIDDPKAVDVSQILQAHLDFARAWSLPENVKVLGKSGLTAEGVRFFTARAEGRLLAIGALCPFEEDHAEIKSMHTLEAARGQGVGWSMLERLVSTAY
ncbi:MAG: GNAT family N-acetyltransferase, partial [Phycisphaerales bacterium]|nr:GNAT family N-acetyltransferase [Phycisphaerales bacterium]